MNVTLEDCPGIKKRLVAVKPEDLDLKWFYGIYNPLIACLLDSKGQDICPAVDSLAIWLQRYIQLQRSNVNVKPSVQLSTESIYRIFDFVCEFWTDSGAILGNALRELLQKLISAIKVSLGDQSVVVYEAFVRKVLKFPRKMRIVYFGIEKLAKHVGGAFILDTDPDFLGNGLCLMHHNGLANSISRALTAIFVNMDHDSETGQLLWIPQTISALLNDSETSSNIQKVFLASIFKSLPQTYEPFITELQATTASNDVDSLKILVSCIQTGLQLGISREFTQKTQNVKLLAKLLQHKSVDLRLSGLGLIVAEKKESTPISRTEMRLVQENLIGILGEVQSGPRSQFSNLLRAFIARLKATAYSIARDQKRISAAKAQGYDIAAKVTQNSMKEILEFFKAALEFSTSHLLPGTPHHFLSGVLHFLEVLIRSGLDSSLNDKLVTDKSEVKFPEDFAGIRIFSPKMVRLLVDNITNPYEDIRVMSLSTLKMVNKNSLLKEDINIETLITRCQDLLDGLRGREADSAARFADLIYYLLDDTTNENDKYLASLVERLQELCHISSTDISVAVLEKPCHGYFAAISAILLNNPLPRNINTLQTSLLESSKEIWDATKDILSHESPEGNIPPAFSACYTPVLEKLHGPAAQVILSFGWRSLKESSNLLNTLLTILPDSQLTDELLMESGEFIISQLSVVKHRGAFSSVYPSFITCCKRCFARETQKNQPLKWLESNVKMIKSSAHYITRRSSGLPFMITAILTAVKGFNGTELDIPIPGLSSSSSKKTNNFECLFSNTFNTLLELAIEPAVEHSDKIELSQVHAINCIRVMFTDAELTDVSARFVDKALKLAIDQFAHPIWSIRNCAVMLFTALQSRIFGHHNEGFMSAKLFFMRYRNIRNVLLAYMQGLDKPNQEIETIYPVLYLLVKLKGVADYDGLADFEPLVIRCLSSRIWKIREMAARVLGAITIPANAVDLVLRLLRECSRADQNKLHGHSLALQSVYPLVVETSASTTNSLMVVELAAEFEGKFDSLLLNNPSPETRLAFFRATKLYEKFDASASLQKHLPYQANSKPQERLSSSERLYRSEIAEYVAIKIREDPDCDTNDLIVFYTELLTDYAYEVKLVALKQINDNVAIVKTTSVEVLRLLFDTLWSLFVDYDWDSVRAPALNILTELSWLEFEEKDSVESVWKRLYSDISDVSTDIINQASLKALGSATRRLLLSNSGAHHFHYHPVHGHDATKLQKAVDTLAHEHQNHEKHEDDDPSHDDHSSKSISSDPHSVARLVLWFRQVSANAHEDQEFPTRLSSLESLANCLDTAIISSNDRTINTSLMQLFDFLCDDDYEIREKAEHVVQRLFPGFGDPDTYHCQINLLNYIASKQLHTVVCHLFKISLMSELASALERDSLLFTVEKQNLYVNPVDYFDLLLESISSKEPANETVLKEYNQAAQLLQERKYEIQAGIDISTDVYMACYKIHRLAHYAKVESPVQDLHPSFD